MVQTGGRAVLRLAGADWLPLEFNNVAETYGKYVKELKKLADDLRQEADRVNGWLSKKTLEAVADPLRTFVPPKPKKAGPFLNVAPLDNAMASLTTAAGKYRSALSRAQQHGSKLSSQTRRELDQVLIQTERALTGAEGLPRRPWYKHQVYAPGSYTGYGVKTFPGVREAIEQGSWDEAEEQVRLAAAAVNGLAALVHRAADLLGE